MFTNLSEIVFLISLATGVFVLLAGLDLYFSRRRNRRTNPAPNHIVSAP